MLMVCHGHDPARSVLVDPASRGRQGQPARRADVEFAPIAVELDRPAQHADRAAGEQVARRLEHQVPGVPDRQETELRAAGQVPEHHAPVRAHGQHSTVVPDRRTVIIDRLAREAWAKVRYSRAGSTWYVVSLSSMPNDDSSVLAEFRRRTSPVKLSHGRPRTGSQSRSRPSQPLLASSVPAGWKAASMPLLVWPSRVAFRVPVAASQR